MLVSDLGQLKISNVCSLSSSSLNENHPSASPASTIVLGATGDQRQPVDGGEYSENMTCAVCSASVPLRVLKSHILIQHFPFYRPYRCCDCRYECGDLDVFIKEHTIISGHQEYQLVGEKIPYLELLVNMITQDTEKLHRQDLSSVLTQLNALKTVAAESKSLMISKKNGLGRPGALLINDVTASADQSQTTTNTTTDQSPTTTRFRLSTQMVRNATDSFLGAEAAAAAAGRFSKRKNSWSSSTTTGTGSPLSHTPTPTPPTAATLIGKTKRRRNKTGSSLVAASVAKTKRRYVKCKLCMSWVIEDDMSGHANSEHPTTGEQSNYVNCFAEAESQMMTDSESDDDDDGVDLDENEGAPIDPHLPPTTTNRRHSTTDGGQSLLSLNDTCFSTPPTSTNQQPTTALFAFSTPPTSRKVPLGGTATRSITTFATPIMQFGSPARSVDTENAVREVMTCTLDLVDEKPRSNTANTSLVPPAYIADEKHDTAGVKFGAQSFAYNNLGDESSNISASATPNSSIMMTSPAVNYSSLLMTSTSTDWSQQDAINTAQYRITCDFCHKTCETKETLKLHCMDSHSEGFCFFYCADCDFKSTNQRRVMDHCRSVHKNAKLMKRSKPTPSQLEALLKIKESFDRKQIASDISAYLK